MRIQETRTVKRILYMVLVIAMMLAMIPASTAFASDTAYDYQPENAKENDMNSIKMLEPADISFVSKENGKYINRINGNIDGTRKEGIQFAFSLTAGMGTFSEKNFIERNLPLIVIYDAEGNVAAQYSEGNGELRYLGNKEENDIRKLYVGVDQGLLDSGDYTIVFGKGICGNNPDKNLGYDIVFNFHVKTSPALSEMISQAEAFVQNVTDSGKVSDSEPGSYPQSAVNQLIQAISIAKQNLGIDNEEQASEELYQALKRFKNQQNFKVEYFEITGIRETVSVGDSGKAEALMEVLPDEEQYKKVIWSVVEDPEADQPADNILIDKLTGKWIAAYSGTVYIKASCVRNPEIAVYKRVTVDSPEGVIAVNLSDDETRLKTMVEKTGASSEQITSVKVFTTGTGKLTSEDISYLKSLENLKTLDLKNATLQTIEASAFAGHTNLHKVTLPETVTSIGDKAFYDCSRLEEINIPSTVTVIGNSVFAKCTSLSSTLKVDAVCPPDFPADGILGSNIKTVQVPYGCSEDYKSKTGWSSFTIKEGLQCRLSVNVAYSGGLEAASQKALEAQGCTEEQITDLIISSPAGVQLSRAEDVDGYLKNHFLNATTIDLSGTQLERNKCNANTFKNRINMKHIVLPYTTENIGKQSFYGCRNLREITIPESVTDIGDSAFGGCTSLNSRIIINAEVPPDSDGAVFPYHVNTIIVPPGSVGRYEASSNWRQFYVEPQITISLNWKSFSLESFAQKTVTAHVETCGNCVDKVYWKTSNSSVVSLNKTTGKTVIVRGDKPGTATITATDASGTVRATCKVTVKALPISVSSAAYNKIKVSWSGITGADGYYVHRYSSSGKLLKSWRFGKTARSFTETGLTTGTTYYYKVRAYKSGRASVYSALKSAKPTLATPVISPVAKYSSGYVKVKWKGISGESGYQVYSATSKNGKYTKVASVKMTTYSYPYAKIKATKGKGYYYKVRAYKLVNGKYVYSSYSSVKYYKLR